MSQNRRDFIKFVVAGAIATGCPIDLSLLAEPTRARSAVDGEDNEICHKVRDGFHFELPAVSSRHEVVIVGGGISGLAAAYYLSARDWLLLEKEPHWGGNAYAMDYNGSEYATGAAFFLDEKDEAAELARAVDLKLLPIGVWDGTILKGEYIPDMWGDGLDKIPYPATVREAFKKFKKEMLVIDVDKRAKELDNIPFSHFLKGYPPALTKWWNCFAPSNWGALVHESSSLAAIGDFQGFANEDRTLTHMTLPGGNGALSKRLSEVLLKKNADSMISSATTISVQEQRSEVHVTYMHHGKLKTVAAKGVIMATPKFITARLVKDLPEAQRTAMMKIRYAPYPLVNLIYDKPVFNHGYDTWCPGTTFTDVIVADWTVRNQPGYKQKYNILSFYTPLRETDRTRLLTEEGSRQIAANVLRDFKRVLPTTNVDPLEVHIYRRGHPMFMATPGTFTHLIPAAKKPMKRVFFANTDSEGPESLTAGGIAAAKRTIREFDTHVAGKQAKPAG